MKLDKFRRPRPVSIVLVLVLSILGLAVSIGPIEVHAAGPALVQSVAPAALVDFVSTFIGWPNAGVSAGDLLAVHVFCMAGANPTAIADTANDVWTQIITNARGAVWYAFAKATSPGITLSGGPCTFSGSPGGAFSAEEFSGVGSIGNNANNNAAQSTSCASNCIQTLSITVTVNNALLYEGFDVYGGGLGACPTITNGGSSQITTQTLQCLNGLAGAFSQGRTTYAANRGIGVNSLSMQSNAWAQVGHELLELDPPGGTPSNLGTQTACYGNCGNPAVTLANTNSTHLVNFNLSITLFYQFQSQLNGQVLNVTTNVAKSYSNGLTMTLGIYVVATCGPGVPAFTTACPGILQKTQSFQNPSKGTNVFANANVPVSAGQWVGLAVTSSLAGLDINDTNTAVQMWQTQGSQGLPAIIAASTVFSAASKVGLWGFITGNTITGIGPPTPPTGGTCAGFLDCLLPNWVASLCTNQTPTCTNASGLIWALILTTFTSFFIWKGGSNILPGTKLPYGEMFLLLLLVWVFVLSGLQLLFVWVPLFFFFVVSLLLGKKTGVYL